jgi:hypothetical protein
MLRTLVQIAFVLMAFASAPLRAVEPTIAIAVTSNGQPVSEGQTIGGVVSITVTVTNGVGSEEGSLARDLANVTRPIPQTGEVKPSDEHCH